MPVSAEEIQAIIDGKPVPIDVPCPFDPGLKWEMKQPVDWQYDMAQAVREAALAEVLAQPEVAAAKRLPPSQGRMDSQERAKGETSARINVLEAKGEAIQPEEALELENLRDYRERLLTPDKYSRADEIANRFASRAFESWLVPRLVVDKTGKPVFDMNTDEGRRKWETLDRETKLPLRGPLYQVLLLVQTAKNSKAGQSSNSK